MKRVVFRFTAVAHIYIALEGEKIDFAGGMELKSDTETDRHSENSGDG